jgi:hypothetical protein
MKLSVESREKLSSRVATPPLVRVELYADETELMMECK